MKSISMLLAAIVTVAFVGCGRASTDHDVANVSATGLTVSVTCSKPDMAFTGTIVSDGRLQTFSGTGSGTYPVDGREIVCSFKKAGADGRISLRVSKGDENQGSSSTIERFGGVRAEFHRSLLKQSALFTTF